MSDITEAQARLVLEKARIQRMIDDMEGGAPFQVVGTPQTRTEAIASHHKRLLLCDELLSVSDEELRQRLRHAVAQLSPLHLAVWMAELVGASIPQTDQQAAMGAADLEVRKVVDVLLSALTDSPKAWLQLAAKEVAARFLTAARGGDS